MVSRTTKRRTVRDLRHLYELLSAAYGPQEWWPAETPFEVVLGAYLTQNTSWKSVERSIANLRANDLLTPAAIREVPEESLRQFIRPSGYMQRKASALKAFVSFLDREYGGSMETLAEEATTVARTKLLSLLGVGPETADAILLYALGHPVMVVDEYLRRIATRHGFTEDRPKYSVLQDLATQAFAKDLPMTHLQHFNEFHALIVEVGKRHCGREPKCEGCPLAPDHSSLSSHLRIRR